MKIGTFEIIYHNDNTISMYFPGDATHYGVRVVRMGSSDARYTNMKSLYNTLKPYSDYNRPSALQDLLSRNYYPDVFPMYGATDATQPEAPETPEVVKDTSTPEEKLIAGMEGLMNFFSEFGFEPSFRFTNTFSLKAQKSMKAVKEYITNYFSLMDSSYKTEVADKVKSKEFDNIIKQIAQYGAPKSTVNNRFKIYFGSAGTGKTTLAQTESDNRCVVCNSSMLPADLMEDFVFTDGNPDFKPSILWECMEQGKPIVLDEINLLPFDSLRFLQGIVDGKSEFSYKNRPVHIHDGFEIIGTMNLTIGGMAYGLPEPLVDRCADIKEFKLTAEQLAKSIMG